MIPGVYRLTRECHLFLGLFISPFVLVFSISAFFLTHSWLPRLGYSRAIHRETSALPLPQDLKTLSGRPLIDALIPVLERMGVHGEIGFVKHLIAEDILIIPVQVPGRIATVSIKIPTGETSIVTRGTGLAHAMTTLHTSPGEHAPAIRMNWFYIRLWRCFADATAYLIIFLSISGTYLWIRQKAERVAGSVIILVGALSFFGLFYALAH